MGRLVADPELKHTPNDIAFSQFRIACDRNYVKQGEEKKTDFIDVTVWRSTAEFVCRYFSKGRMIALEGSLRVDNFTDKEGNKRTKYFIESNNVYFADSKSDSKRDDEPGRSEAHSAPAPAAYSNGADGDFEVVEDDGDLPF